MNNPNPPDLDAIARNLIYLDLGHIELDEAAAYEAELSAIASLNEAIETTTAALNGPHPQLWQKVFPLLSDAAALLSCQIASLIDLNAERTEAFPLDERPTAQPAEQSEKSEIALAYR